MAATAAVPRALILDTNIVLDYLLFGDPSALRLQAQVNAALADATQWRWIATQRMRDELAHVLLYPHLQPMLAHYQHTPETILAQFDQRTTLVEPAIACTLYCRDSDDQMFIDLAVAHQGMLLSKDKQVLKLRKRMARAGAWADTNLPAPDAS
ncbi:putative toxin-antitoxin system toxin component, PIN family [Lampropedia puyangensis]|uniref:Putative toxin-antitoxin system toxin component, PIN family n=2 Tax=Lampropedia puyangensis TaxID=1330072 RepID=A0A4V4GQS2_9BURK|nr:putative toxin-antitoxin system toxin component, PIN family [Lampropedia puyangensis]